MNDAANPVSVWLVALCGLAFVVAISVWSEAPTGRRRRTSRQWVIGATISFALSWAWSAGLFR